MENNDLIGIGQAEIKLLDAPQTPEGTGESRVVRDDKGKFVKGVTGNPQGRPPGTLSITEAIRARLKETGTLKNGEKKQYLAILVDEIIKMALIEGDVQMVKEIWHAIDGMPKQSIGLKGDLDVSDHSFNDKEFEEIIEYYVASSKSNALPFG